jgi:hypothetical protein
MNPVYPLRGSSGASIAGSASGPRPRRVSRPAPGEALTGPEKDAKKCLDEPLPDAVYAAPASAQ